MKKFTAVIITIMLVATSIVPVITAQDAEPTVLFEETFGNSAEVLPQPLASSTTEGYENWYLETNSLAQANSEGTYVEIEKEADADNNVLRMTRTTQNGDYAHLIPMYKLPTIPKKETIELTWRMKYNENNHYIFWRNTIAQIRDDQIVLVNGMKFEPSGDAAKAAINTKDVWHNYKLVLNYTAQTVSMYIDDIQIGETLTASDDKPMQELKTIELLQLRSHAKAVGTVYIDDIKITQIPDPDWLVFDDIANGQAMDNITENLNLITSSEYYTFSWTSSKPEVISADGVVIASDRFDEVVTLTAEAFTKSGEKLGKKEFVVTVKAVDDSKNTIYFKETFGEPADVLPQPLASSTTEGYGDWYLETNVLEQANNEGTYVEIEKESYENNVMRMTRSQNGGDLAHLIAMYNLPVIPMKDTVKLSWRMKYNETNHYVFWRNTFSQIRHDQVVLANGMKFIPADKVQTEKINTPGVWHVYELVLNYTSGTTSMFIDGVQIGDKIVATSDMPMKELKTIELLQLRTETRAKGTVYFDDITITHIPDPEWVTFADISNGQNVTNVTSDLNLITQKSGLNIEWEIDKPELISAEGQILKRPKLADETATLTAIIKDSDNREIGRKVFVITMPVDGEVLWTETFDDAPIGTDLIGGPSVYNNWVIDSRSAVGGSVSTVDRAKAEGTYLQMREDPDNKENQALFVSRKLRVGYDTSPVDGGDPTNWFAKNKIQAKPSDGQITKINDGLVYFSGRVWFAETSGRVWIEPFGQIQMTSWNAQLPSTFYFNSGAKYTFTAEEQALWKVKSWNNFGFLLNFYDHSAQMYVNGQTVGQEVFMTLSELNELTVFMMRNEAIGSQYLDDLMIKRSSLTDSELVEMAISEVKLNTPETGLIETLTMPDSSRYGTKISWASSHPDILTAEGFLARPKGDDVTVTLTATLTKGEASSSKEFYVVVKGYSESEYRAYGLDFEVLSGGQKEWYVTESLTLPTSHNGAAVTWSSSNKEVLSDSGAVSRKREDVVVTLSGTFTYGDDTFTRDYNLMIAGDGKILTVEDFTAPSTEGQTVNGWNGWEIEEAVYDDCVSALIKKDINDGLAPYNEAEKVLSLTRTVTAGEAKVSNQKTKKNLKNIKPEIMKLDFDFLFRTDNSILYLELEGMNRHYAISKTGIGLKAYPETPFGKTLEVNKWYHITIEQDSYTNTYSVYLDYEKLNDEPIYAPGTYNISSLNFYSNAITATLHENFMIRRIMVRDVTPSAELAVNNAKQELTLAGIDYNTARIELPLYGIENTSLSWTSSNNDVISTDGVVTRQAEATDVILTANIKKGDVSVTKDFVINVLANDLPDPTVEIMKIIASQLTEEDITDEPQFRITKNLELPKEITNGRAADIGGVNITWKSNYPAIITDDGVITPQQYEAAATLTATLTAKSNPSVSAQKALKFAVDMGGEEHHDFHFEDTTDKTAGASIDTWSGIELRSKEQDTEYGVQIFSDKEPQDRYLSHEDANHAMFINRYTTAKYDPVTYMAHATIKKFSGYYYGDVIALSFRFKFKNSGEKLKPEIYCLVGKNTYLTPSSYEIGGGSFNHTFKEPLALNEWHNMTLYFDTLSWREDIYVNGECISSQPVDYGAGPYKYLNQWRLHNDNLGYLIVDDLRVRSISVPNDAAIMTADVNRISVPQTITEDINLPSNAGRCAVTWSSSDESVISDGGKINPSSSVSKSATLTATFRYGTQVQTKSFNVTVPAQTAYKADYEIGNINITGGKVTGVSLSRKNATANNNKLLVAVYDQEALCGLYSYDMADDAIGANRTVLTDISLDGTINYKIKAFVWSYDNDSGKQISNLCIAKEASNK
ncbi:MAG: hypothetical protein II978_05795 [Clostridia bacterium]|nr:hypothetical protein [Clostridia bacterium]